MCCNSHGQSADLRSLYGNTMLQIRVKAHEEEARQARTLGPIATGDTKASGEMQHMRCLCEGFGSVDDMAPDDRRYGCRCDYVITGEDMRCNRCRRFCDLTWTPRLMSDALKGATQ